MRFNVKRIARGLSQFKHAASRLVFGQKKKPEAGKKPSAPKKQAGPKEPKAPPLPGTVPPKPPKAVKPAAPKSLKPGVKMRQKGFKAKVKMRNTANPPMGTNSKPLNKQQRAQGALAAMAAWKQKRKVSP